MQWGFTAARARVLVALLALFCAAPACDDDPCSGVVCGAGRVCVDGQCVSEDLRCGETFCTGGKSCCGELCVDTDRDPNHCGGCEHACGATADSCEDGACLCGSSSACTGDDVCCGGSCVEGTEHGTCPTVCGDGSCSATEDCHSCETDCGPCSTTCPDGACTADEDCKNCPDDCGECAAECGDGECNGDETCVDCEVDCGSCECPPGHVDFTTDGCPTPCTRKERSCKEDGSWDVFGACEDYCSPGQICHNNACVDCVPGTVATEPCPCGEKEKECQPDGTWGPLGDCVSRCDTGDGFTCHNDRCEKEYDAYASAGGGACGYTGSSPNRVYLYCEPLDYCTSSSGKDCRKYQYPQPGDRYHASKSGDGHDCGYVYENSVKHYVFCRCRDKCYSSSSERCEILAKECNEDYYACRGPIEGPSCGYATLDGVQVDFRCLAGDDCTSHSSDRCEVRTSCTGSTIYYEAYETAGGTPCGDDYLHVDVFCMPGHSCSSTSSNRCKR